MASRIGGMTQWSGSVADRSFLQGQVNRLRNDSRNLTARLYLELLWKHTNLTRGGPYLRSLIDNDDQARRICGSQLIRYCETFTGRVGRPPKVLDFGCGPVSSLAYLVHEGLADVVGADAIADEYRELLERHGLKSPVPQRRGIGEYLDEEFDEEQFDVVHVRDALDSTQAPVLTWLNLFRVVRIGGILVHSHSIRKAATEGSRRIHHVDLYPDATSLWMEDADGVALSLSDALPLTVHWTLRHGDRWFGAAYERQPGDAGPSFVWAALQQLRRTFRRRSSWTCELERFAGLLAADLVEGSTPLDIPIQPDRA